MKTTMHAALGVSLLATLSSSSPSTARGPLQGSRDRALDPIRLARAADVPLAVGSRVFELRTYHAAPGKLQALHARFRDHTNALFRKHGMTIVGFWVPMDADKGSADTLVYILAHESRAAAEASWAAFRADPDWQKARAESEKDGSLTTKVESVFMSATDYSPMK